MVFRIYIIALLFFVDNFSIFSQEFKDLVYAEVDQRQLLVDIYLPSNIQLPKLVVWIHGGAWHSGSKDNPPKMFTDYGYALASVDYRLSGEATYPAMIHDIKAAIRYLRANAGQYGYQKDKIIIAGSSAGGHLAALVGTSNGVQPLEGILGNYLQISSDVQLVIDLFGPTNFLTILNQSTPHGLDVRVPALQLLLGKPLEEVVELAKEASPVYQVDQTDPPLFIAHGDQDNQVPINQSIELYTAYKNLNIPVQFEIVTGAGHGSKDYYTADFMQKIDKFIRRSIF